MKRTGFIMFLTVFCLSAFISMSLRGQSYMLIHKTDGNVIEVETTEIDSISFRVTENDPLEISFETPLVQLNVGETKKLSVRVNNGDVRDLQWSSNNENVATVKEGVVTAMGIGTCIITARIGDVAATCQVSVKKADEHSYVDLGLSVMWATCNVGAENSWSYGEYYSWGETETKSNFSWSTYKWCSGSSYNTLTKYCYNYSYSGNGVIDDKRTLDLEDDAAHVNWGGYWRMPTSLEMRELIDSCTWEWTQINGVNGYKVTSNRNGFTDKFIFMPAGGYKYEKGLDLYGSNCVYWSSTLSDEKPIGVFGISFSSKDRNTSYYTRYQGFCVRPVRPSDKWIDKLTLELDNDELDLYVNDTFTLTAILKNDGQVLDNSFIWSTDNPYVATIDANGTVIGISKGSANISVSFCGITAVCTVNVSERESHNDYEYVDLGLSALWGTSNLGTSKPEKIGSYYSWGEIETKSEFNWSTYKYAVETSDYYLTKYCYDSRYGNDQFTDNKYVLDLSDDVAHVDRGGDWRIPTSSEFRELIKFCTWTYTTQNGKYGYRVTSKVPGYTGRSLFIPIGGLYEDTDNTNTEYGVYWSNLLHKSNPSYAMCLLFNSTAVSVGGINRMLGVPVRPVCTSDRWPGVTSVELERKYITLLPHNSYEAKVTVLSGKLDYSDLSSIEWSSNNPEVAYVKNGVIYACLAGTTTVIAKYNDLVDSCTVEVENVFENGHDYVDLGLSVKWASVNVGASEPEDYGNYYSWGDITTRETYSWYYYRYAKGSRTTLTKYCFESKQGYDDFTDNKMVLDPEDDVAYVEWGGNWRMPTKDEQEELITNCDWTKTVRNGVNGFIVTSKIEGYTDRSIFIPLSGYYENSKISDRGECGYLWSNTLSEEYTSDGYNLYMESKGNGVSPAERFYGLSIRPVLSSKTWIDSISFTLSSDTLSIVLGDTVTLSPIIKLGDEVVNYHVYWSSDNPSVAMVDENGVVFGNSIGTARITAECHGKKSVCYVIVPELEKENGYMYMDLGLSVKWAVCNVGADNPEDAGNYYSWGETRIIKNFTWNSYLYCDGAARSLTKYCTNNSFGNNGFADNKTVLDLDDDVAYQEQGGNWRMPTLAEFQELLDSCTCVDATQNGVNGYRFISNVAGYTDCSIFLPASGDYDAGRLNNNGSIGYYWSSSLNGTEPSSANYLLLKTKEKAIKTLYRYYGLSIRPVCP